jgi:hypothetical protein
MNKTKASGIDRAFSPPYSPSHTLIERVWKFTKKTGLYSPYVDTCRPFKAAVDECLKPVKSTGSEPVKTLLKPKVQLFGKSASVTA